MAGGLFPLPYVVFPHFRTSSNAKTVQYLPPWLPGASFKKWAKKALVHCTEFTQVPYAYAKNRTVSRHRSLGAPRLTLAKVSGEDSLSFVSRNLGSDSVIDKKQEEILMYAAAGFYLGTKVINSCLFG